MLPVCYGIFPYIQGTARGPSIDVRISRLGIPMKRGEPTKTIMTISNQNQNKRPAGHHNTPPRPRDRHFTGCILP